MWYNKNYILTKPEIAFDEFMNIYNKIPLKNRDTILQTDIFKGLLEPILARKITIKDNVQILAVSRMSPGRRHDFRMREEGKPLPGFSNKYVDSGYQGLQKTASNVTMPFRGSKKRPLTPEQKKHNKSLASFRAKVEHKFRELKIFKILRDVYRNFQKKHNMRFNVIAGIVNLKYGF